MATHFCASNWVQSTTIWLSIRSVYLLSSDRPSGMVTGGSFTSAPMIHCAETCSTDIHPQSCSVPHYDARALAENCSRAGLRLWYAPRSQRQAPGCLQSTLCCTAQPSCSDGLYLSIQHKVPKNRQTTNRQTEAG